MKVVSIVHLLQFVSVPESAPEKAHYMLSDYVQVLFWRTESNRSETSFRHKLLSLFLNQICLVSTYVMFMWHIGDNNTQ